MMKKYMRSQPSDGSSQGGRLLVGVQRPGRRREVRVVEEEPSVAADAFQLVVVGRVMPGSSDARRRRRSSAVVGGRRLLIGPIPGRAGREKRESIHNYISTLFLFIIIIIEPQCNQRLVPRLTTVERNLPSASLRPI